MTEKERGNLNLYNAYDPGLFGLQHAHAALNGLNIAEADHYLNMKRLFVELCNRLGDRVLFAMKNGSALVTPQPINRELGEYLANILGVDNNSVTAVDVAGEPGDLLPERVLASGKVMDNLRAWTANATHPILQPRTITEMTLVLAEELGVDHGHILPDGVFKRQITGRYPSAEYLQGHPAEVNNSKVLSYLRLQELDTLLGTEMAPRGGVAYSDFQLVRETRKLLGQGYSVMIKADLSVDGMGNVRVERDMVVDSQDINDCSDEMLLKYLLSRLAEKTIPFGDRAPVVVSEFLTDKIYDPSFEVYSPPREWGEEPKIYYSCGMLIENGGFTGSIINDPLLAIANYGGLGVNRKEYKNLLDETARVVLAFAKIMWLEGYVGISDCDLALCRNARTGRLYTKILEFNYNRETGGTASYHYKQRLDKINRARGYVVARDTVAKTDYYASFAEMLGCLTEDGIDYRPGFGGVLALGHRLDEVRKLGKLMSLTWASDIDEALRLDGRLVEINNHKTHGK